MRFDWLVKKDDYNSFGVQFHVFVVTSMCISFFSMVKALLSYHNRTRESVRMTFSLNNLFTILMFVVILLVKIIVYMYGFQNSPGLFFVPVFVKIALTWLLLSFFEPNFSALMSHDKLVYLLVSYLVPISIPVKERKRKMAPNYGISLFLFYAECGSIILYAVMVKKFYHFKLFRKFYSGLPQLLNLPKFDFEEISFFLFLLCLAATILAGLFRCLATGRFHPSKTLFARKRSSRESEREVEAEAAENTGFQPE